MNRNWTPDCHVSTTEAGMVIKVELGEANCPGLGVTYESGQLCIRGTHKNFGQFETRVHIPPGYSVAKLKCIFLNGVLRIELPPGDDKPFFSDFPKNMLIYCDGCGKHFDIVITGKGAANYCCPTCGKVQVFDLEALVKQAMEQGKRMLGKKRGRQ